MELTIADCLWDSLKILQAMLQCNSDVGGKKKKIVNLLKIDQSDDAKLTS